MELNHTIEMECSTKEVKIDMPDSENSSENLLERKLSELPQKPKESEPITIPRIPSDILEINKIYYEPREVSIGPYYHGRERYQDMEKHKIRYLRDFLSRHEVGLDVLIKEVRLLAARAKQCYSGFICFDNEQFVQILLLDGCFILEVWSKKINKEHDALLDMSWVFNRIVTDFLLIQNQIPFFVIHKLYSVSYRGLLSEGECGNRILHDLTHFVQSRAPMLVWPRRFQIPHTEIHHLLHFYQEFYVPKKTKVQINLDQDKQSSLLRRSIHYLESIFTREAEQKDAVYLMPSATELREAGVTFRKKQFPENFLDITFKNGVFEMPMISCSLEEKTTILNLIAWNAKNISEHRKQSKDPIYLYPLLSYTILLESLLRKKNDIQLFKERGIIENSDPSDEQLAHFFNHLGDLNVVFDDFLDHADFFSDIKRYYDDRWHRYRAKLKRDYFHNPWSIISVVAGTILLVLTGVQAICAIDPVICR
jgi:Plant protein of unknown function